MKREQSRKRKLRKRHRSLEKPWWEKLKDKKAAIITASAGVKKLRRTRRYKMAQFFFKVTYLRCKNAHKFMARDEQGKPRKGAATVRRILASGITQKCPYCQNQ